MKKEQFLKELKHSLRKFDNNEIDQVINYYDEMISDKIEMGQTEDSIIASLGSSKDISREVQLDLISNRVQNKNNIEKTSSSFFILFALLLSPALFPIAIVLFVVFFTIIVTSGALMFGFGATTISLIVSLIPSVIFTAQTVGAGSAIFTVGVILLLSAAFGLLTIAFYKLTKEVLAQIIKFTLKIAKKNKRKI